MADEDYLIDPNLERLARLGEASFLKEHDAFLLGYNFPCVSDALGTDIQEAPKIEPMGKITTDLDDKIISASRLCIFPVIKRTELFPQFISAGRAQNSDIIIPDKRISATHALFVKADGVYKITDANSTNGTYLNKVRLPPNQSYEQGNFYAVSDFDGITFWEYKFTFLQGKSIIDVLRKIALIQTCKPPKPL